MDRSNTRAWWIGGAVIVLLALGLVYYYSTTPAHAGTVYVTVSDASADMQNVSDVMMTVDKVEMRDSTGAWVTVSNTPHTYKLMSLKANGKAEFYGKADIAAGNYDQIRATVSKVQVQTKDGSMKDVAVASKTFVMTGSTVVREGQSSHANLDIHTSDSMHMATNGSYVFTPVINFKSHSNANVSVGSDNYATMSGGTEDTNTTAGSDLSGQMHANAALSPNVQIQLNGSVMTMVSGTASGTTGTTNGQGSTSGSTSGSTNGSASSNTNANASGMVQIDSNGTINVNVPVSISGSAQTNTNTQGQTNGTSGSTNGSTNTNTGTSGGASVNVNGSGSVNVGH